jgi:hypothetical protein
MSDGQKGKCFVVALSKSDNGMEAKVYGELKKDSQRSSDFVTLLRGCDDVKKYGKKLFVDLRKTENSTSGKVLLLISLARHPLLLARVNAERIAIIKQLKELGYRVAVPDYGIANQRTMDKIRPYARIFRAKAPIRNRSGKTVEYHPSACWARDLWQKIAGVRVKRFMDQIINPCGEGGLSVPINDGATLMNWALRDEPLVRALAGTGHKFYFLNDGVVRSKSCIISPFDIYLVHDHIDLFVGVNRDMRIMLVDRAYFANNEAVLKCASTENGLKTLFVPKEESDFHPANFKNLDNGRVIVDSRAVKTIALLRGSGVDVISSRVPIRANLICGGGIRCFVNEM